MLMTKTVAQVIRSLLLVGGSALVCIPSAAAEEAASPSKSTWPSLIQRAETGPRSFVTEHHGIFGGKKVAYRATVAETVIKDTAGAPAASLFTFAYTAKGGQNLASRPVIFIYNGGPGGSSDTLHFGALGPKRMTPFTGAAQADPNT